MSQRSKRILVLFIACALLGLCIIFNTGSVNVIKKNLQADLGAGLNRTVTVYTNTGIPIKTWRGKIDLAYSDNWVNMLINGDKRIIIKGGITIVEEH